MPMVFAHALKVSLIILESGFPEISCNFWTKLGQKDAIFEIFKSKLPCVYDRKSIETIGKLIFEIFTNLKSKQQYA